MKGPATLLAVALLILSLALIGYRILWLKYPILPAAPARVWQLSMDASIKGGEKETTVLIGLPSTQRGQLVVDEHFHPGTLSFNLLREGPNQIGVWSGHIGPGDEAIEYRSTIQVQPQHLVKTKPPKLGSYPSHVGETEQKLARRLVEKWDPLPPADRLHRIAAALNGSWGTPPPEPQELQAWSAFQNKHGRVIASLVLLRAAGLTAQVVEGLPLAESITNSTVTWIEVWTGEEWEHLQPEKGEI